MSTLTASPMSLDTNGRLPLCGADGCVIQRYWLEYTSEREVFLHLGNSWSNAYYGSSRIAAPVYQCRRIGPGDLICLIHGGLRLIENGRAHKIRTSPPKDSPFERDHAPSNDYQVAIAIKAGLMRFVEAPNGAIDFSEPTRMFTDHHPSVID